jgi:hypothetical protein
LTLTEHASYKARSAFTRVTAYTLALSPYFVTRFPKASAISSPPQLLRLLPAGAVAGWDLHPLESAALSRRTPIADIARFGPKRGLLTIPRHRSPRATIIARRKRPIPGAIHAVPLSTRGETFITFFIEPGGNCDNLLVGLRAGGRPMTRWLLLIVVFGIATISDHCIAAEISRDQIATLWQSSCNPWVDYNCAAPKISPKTLRAMERSGNCDPYLRL